MKKKYYIMTNNQTETDFIIGWMRLTEFQYTQINKLPGITLVPEDLAQIIFNTLIHMPAILKGKRPIPMLDLAKEMTLEELHERL